MFQLRNEHEARRAAVTPGQQTLASQTRTKTTNPRRQNRIMKKTTNRRRVGPTIEREMSQIPTILTIRRETRLPACNCERDWGEARRTRGANDDPVLPEVDVTKPKERKKRYPLAFLSSTTDTPRDITGSNKKQKKAKQDRTQVANPSQEQNRGKGDDEEADVQQEQQQQQQQQGQRQGQQQGQRQGQQQHQSSRTVNRHKTGESILVTLFRKKTGKS